MTEQKEYSVKVLEYDSPSALGFSLSREAVEAKNLPTGFVIRDDGLYYEGFYQPGQSRNVLPAVNKLLASWLGVDR